MGKKTIRTFHPLAVAESLERQNEAIMGLVMAVETMLTVAGDTLPSQVRDMVRAQADACRAALWPDDDEA
jgi:hypothetical protein